MPNSIIAANWKMNKTFDEGIKLVEEICEADLPSGVTVILCPPFIHLRSISSMIAARSALHLGAQNLHQAEEGAYTGEISAPQLRSVGAEYVLVGHSERRTYFHETNDLLAQKIKARVCSRPTRYAMLRRKPRGTKQRRRERLHK